MTVFGLGHEVSACDRASFKSHVPSDGFIESGVQLMLSHDALAAAAPDELHMSDVVENA